MTRSGGRFSDEEIQLLKKLPAVANVTRDRITYSDTFRQVCTIRYLAGESPTKIFREAGLPPELIGYKRIERCVARWKADAMKSAQAGKRMSDRDIIAGLVERYERALVVRQRLDRNLSQLADTLGVKQPADTASSDEHNGAAPASQQDDEAAHHTDVSGQVIARQAKRIIELEQALAQLRGDMHQGNPNRRSGA